MLSDAPLVSLIPTVDLDEARAFYADILELPLVEQNEYAAVFEVAGRMLRITVTEGFTPQPFSIIGWEVDDIAGTAGALQQRGVPFERYAGIEQDDSGIWTAPGTGSRVAWFLDPDGNVLSLVQSP